MKMADESSTAAVRVAGHRKGRFVRRGEVKRDLISSLPNEILEEILSFIPTKLAITTSVLSKRWRHVWCHTPSLSLDIDNYQQGINKTLTRYAAPMIVNFYLKTSWNIPERDKWIEFAMSRNAENLSLDFSGTYSYEKYKFPDFFYMNSSLKRLTLKYATLSPICPVSWPSLKKLSLHSCSLSLSPICPVSWPSLKQLSLGNCDLSDETMAKILSGCPILESLTLYSCDKLKVLDLSKSLRLRELVIEGNFPVVAPHIRCLSLSLGISHSPCTLVDVSSVTEANLDICSVSSETISMADFLQTMVLDVLDKLQDAEKLTLGGKFLQILSLAELCGLPFPMLKVKALTLKTMIFQYVIPGVRRMLQNSPDLKKLTLCTTQCDAISEEDLEIYLKSLGLNPNRCWRSKDGVFWNNCGWEVELKHVVSFVELMLKNTKALAKMVLLLEECDFGFMFKRLVQILSHYNNVAIVLLTND